MVRNEKIEYFQKQNFGFLKISPKCVIFSLLMSDIRNHMLMEMNTTFDCTCRTSKIGLGLKKVFLRRLRDCQFQVGS